jgi:Methyltransferase domain
MNYPIPQGFFDQHSLFLSTSRTGAFLHRLNQRYRACIEWNEMAIRGKRILDLASHDGRWSYAAIKAGAANVVGIEAREGLVQAAISNLRHYEVPENSFRFVLGDVFQCLDQIEPNSIDTVFCFGYFYHVANHMLLLSKIASLKPKHLIVDTGVHPDPLTTIVMYLDDPRAEHCAARFDSEDSKPVVVGAPSKTALELMLRNFDWQFAYFDWHQAGIHRWDNIEDYRDGLRVTLRIDCTREPKAA